MKYSDLNLNANTNKTFSLKENTDGYIGEVMEFKTVKAGKKCFFKIKLNDSETEFCNVFPAYFVKYPTFRYFFDEIGDVDPAGITVKFYVENKIGSDGNEYTNITSIMPVKQPIVKAGDDSECIIIPDSDVA